jgi:hypothetical protein
MSETTDSVNLSKKFNRKFSLKDKRALYQKWKMSNKSRYEFCKSEEVTSTSFYQWCKLFECQTKKEVGTPEGGQNGFAPILHRSRAFSENDGEATEKMMIELRLPNQTMIKLYCLMNQANYLIQEWCNAAAVVR